MGKYSHMLGKYPHPRCEICAAFLREQSRRLEELPIRDFDTKDYALFGLTPPPGTAEPPDSGPGPTANRASAKCELWVEGHLCHQYRRWRCGKKACQLTAHRT